MARGKLFEYAVIYHPQEKKDAAGNVETKKSVLVTPVTWVLAASEKEVGILVGRGLPEEYLDKLDDVEIVIRPL